MIPQRAATATKVAPATCELELQLVLAVDCSGGHPGGPAVRSRFEGFDSLQEWLWPTLAP